MRKWYSLIDKIYKHSNLYEAFRLVKRNKGAAGIDKISIPLFEENLAINIHKIQIRIFFCRRD